MAFKVNTSVDVGGNGRWDHYLKVACLGMIYFLLIAAYTVAKELQGSLFSSIVGEKWIPIAKWPTMILLIPVTLLYATMVDRMKRYQLLIACTVFFSITGLIVAIFIGHPTIGLLNTQESPNRIFGWLIYLMVEGYTPFLVSVFWAFVNSVTGPEDAKQDYASIVSCSKIGGMGAAGLAWYVFSRGGIGSLSSDVAIHQAVFATSSILLSLVPVVLLLMRRIIPRGEWHGYEAVYKVERKQQYLEDKHKKVRGGVFDGLRLLLKYPYVMGIFGIIFSYEIIVSVLSYLRIITIKSGASSVSDFSGKLFKIIFFTHAGGFLIATFGTAFIMKRLGEKLSLMLIPLSVGVLLLLFMIYPTDMMLTVTYATMKSINYAFSYPVRESLYIPTVNEIRFKSRAWIDAFGGKFAKLTGNLFNLFTSSLVPHLFLLAHSVFFAIMIAMWFITSLLLGRRFETAVANNEVIGVKKEENKDE